MASRAASRRRHVGRSGLIALVSALALLVAGCGADAPDGDDPGGADGPDEVDVTDPDPDPSDDEIDESPAPDGEPDDEPEPDRDPGYGEEMEARVEVLVYLSRDGEGDPCEDVQAVTRSVAAEDPIGEALVELLAGPTDDERATGYGGWFSADTEGMLLGYREVDGFLEVDFADLRPVIPNASSSCGSTLLLAQLDETLGQFPDLDEPRYALDGDVDAFYEWLQRSAPTAP